MCAQPNHLWEWKDIETLTGSTQAFLSVGVDGEMKPQDAADKLVSQMDDCMKKFASEAVIQDTLYRKPCLDVKGFGYLL